MLSLCSIAGSPLATQLTPSDAANVIGAASTSTSPTLILFEISKRLPAGLGPREIDLQPPIVAFDNLSVVEITNESIFLRPSEVVFLSKPSLEFSQESLAILQASSAPCKMLSSSHC